MDNIRSWYAAAGGAPFDAQLLLGVGILLSLLGILWWRPLLALGRRARLHIFPRLPEGSGVHKDSPVVSAEYDFPLPPGGGHALIFPSTGPPHRWADGEGGVYCRECGLRPEDLPRPVPREGGGFVARACGGEGPRQGIESDDGEIYIVPPARQRGLARAAGSAKKFWVPIQDEIDRREAAGEPPLKVPVRRSTLEALGMEPLDTIEVPKGEVRTRRDPKA